MTPWDSPGFDVDESLDAMLKIAARLLQPEKPDDVTHAFLAERLAQHATDLHEHLRRGGTIPRAWLREE